MAQSLRYLTINATTLEGYKMTIDRHIQTARKHLAVGNVEAYKGYMRALFNRSMSKQTTNKLLAALKQDGMEV